MQLKLWHTSTRSVLGPTLFLKMIRALGQTKDVSISLHQCPHIICTQFVCTE